MLHCLCLRGSAYCLLMWRELSFLVAEENIQSASLNVTGVFHNLCFMLVVGVFFVVIFACFQALSILTSQISTLPFKTPSCVHKEAKTTCLCASGGLCSQFLFLRDHKQGRAASLYATPATAFLAGAKTGRHVIREFHIKQAHQARVTFFHGQADCELWNF